ncbi:MAG: hypothetical protein ACRENP_12980 [Longimicrobiales bacterium]
MNIPAALLTANLVITSLATIRSSAAGSRWLQIGTLLVALAVGLTSLTFALEAVAQGGHRNGMPAFASGAHFVAPLASAHPRPWTCRSRSTT